jgi:GH18 family chitinase
MKRSLPVLGLLIALQACTGGSVKHAPASFWVSGYYQTWSADAMPPRSMDLRGLTHIIHFATGPDLDPAKGYFVHDDVEYKGQQSELISYAHENDVKVLMSIGGVWNEGAAKMCAIVTNNQDTTKCLYWNQDQQQVSATIPNDPNSLDTFVTTALSYARNAGYDGIEIDWESQFTPETYRALVVKVREMLDAWETRGLLALAAGNCCFDSYSPDLINNYVDQFNIMMYDMDYVASGYCYIDSNPLCTPDVLGFLAPLHRPNKEKYPAIYNFGSCYDGMVSCDWDYTTGNCTPNERLENGPLKFVEKGIDPLKIAPGVPFYSKLWKDEKEPGNPRRSSVGANHFCTYEGALKLLTVGGKEHWEEEAQVPWIGGVSTQGSFSPCWGQLVDKDQEFYLTYENAKSIAAKARWTIDSGLGGIMAYGIGDGWVTNPADGVNDPLLKALSDEVAR